MLLLNVKNGSRSEISGVYAAKRQKCGYCKREKLFLTPLLSHSVAKFRLPRVLVDTTREGESDNKGGA